MQKDDVALQLTLKAMELNGIRFLLTSTPSDTAEIEKANAFNAKQVEEYYRAIHEKISQN